MNNKKHYNYLSVVVTILVLVIVGLVLYFVYHSVGLGANNALTDPSTSPANPLMGIFQKIFKLVLP